MNIMKFPKIDLKELEREKIQNREERLKFIEQYASWVKKTSGKKVGEAQRRLYSK